MEAAASGQGIVLGTRPVIDDDLKSKRLVLAHPSEWIGGYSYQFICRPGGFDNEKIRSFYNWISAEARYPSQ
jgi:DNA-binding transcriptional LysR family regulator